ncbi:Nrap protein [Rhizodiscina lignyota]|uniref:U3 small nucleolar RNA-associated protein 22 n=1 Tax=Rhizodiscina lignyota TaxID=1504668 RepID=A0A9P4M829_9PEZI|nr:Nrap protein [Rhizodiscina lignyota]
MSAHSEAKHETSHNGADEKLSYKKGREARRSTNEEVPSRSAAKRLPSAGPVNRHRQTRDVVAYSGNLYHSNTFNIQLHGLLERARPKPTQFQDSIDTTLRTLKSIIERIPNREPLPIAEAERVLMKKNKVVVPFPSPRPSRDSNYKLQYEKPTRINAIGSYALKQTIRAKEGIIVDLAVTMPASMFQEKDFLDYRYFYRRAYYIACIAAGIKDSKEKYMLSFELLHGNYLLPVLSVAPLGDEIDSPYSSFRIQIIPTIADGVFPLERILPSKGCIRPKSASEGHEQQESTPTPFYNASLRQDSLVTSYLKLAHDAATLSESFRDACVLGRTWLRQHGFGSHIQAGGFGNFEWEAMMATLLQGGRTGSGFLSPGYSSYQLFKGMLQFIASKDLIKTPFFSETSDIALPQDNRMPFFFDASRGHNLLYKMTVWSYRLLRHEAQMATAMLADTLFDQFDAAFMTKANETMHRYDATCRLNFSNLQGLGSIGDMHASEACNKLYDMLLKGLTDRVRVINIDTPRATSWALGSSSAESDGMIVVGFIVDPAEAAREMDYGPSQENKKDAKAFRQFWGEKAELRKFSDNRIIESVRWDTANTERPIFEQIISYLLARHFGKSIGENVIFKIDPLSQKILKPSEALASKAQKFRSLLTSFSTLESNIRELEGLPLQVRHIFPADPLLRYASLDIPGISTQILTAPADVVLQFEGSGRWPDDLGAIQRTKIAFLLKLGDLLTSAYPNVIARVGLEKESQPISNLAFLDVTYTSTGFTFRIRIYNDREATLLERELKLPGISPLDKESNANALAIYKRNFLRRPAHTQALQTLCTRHPSLSPAIRLAKAWFASHMLLDDNYISHELVELLVVRTFTDPWPWGVPSSASTAFARTLHWIANWDWKTEPLIVNFSVGIESSAAVADGGISMGMKASDIVAIRTRFEAWRKIDPALNRVVLFAASSVDGEGTTWTDHARPAKVVAGRMTALARAASKLIVEKGFEIEPNLLFEPELMEFDFILRLDPKVAKKRSKRSDANGKSQFKNLEMQGFSHGELEKLGFDPVSLLLEELRDQYGELVLFFYDQAKEDVIAGLWNPSMEVRKWKIALGMSSMPPASAVNGQSEGSETVRINKKAILHDIVGRLGGDMIRKLEVNKQTI